eukprot:XP_001704485.1 Hypothetical protein GL50803_21102 [Giardia lamblia ATCC 50803]
MPIAKHTRRDELTEYHLDVEGVRQYQARILKELYPADVDRRNDAADKSDEAAKEGPNDVQSEAQPAGERDLHPVCRRVDRYLLPGLGDEVGLEAVRTNRRQSPKALCADVDDRGLGYALQSLHLRGNAAEHEEDDSVEDDRRDDDYKGRPGQDAYHYKHPYQ